MQDNQTPDTQFQPTNSYSPNQAPATQPAAEPTPAPQSHSHKLFWIIIIVLLVAALAGNGWQYYDNHNKTTTVTAVKTSTQTGNISATQYATNTGIGYPLSLKGKEVLMTLSAPQKYTIMQTYNLASTQDAYSEVYTASLNDYLAHWALSDEGTADKPSTPSTGSGDIYVSAMNDWMTKADPSTVQYDLTLFNPQSGPMTVAQK